MSTFDDNEIQENNAQARIEDKISDNAQVTDEQLINWIKSRRSIGNLGIPAPTHTQIEAAIECAVTAPDHKKLQPWRFIITEGNARHQLGRAFLAAAEAKAAREGEVLSEKTQQKTYNMPLSTVWRTGLLCNEPAVKEYFGVTEDDYVTAFVYTGTSPCDKPVRKPMDVEPLLRFES